ncbi:3-hydroxyacyl-CoA dehydrogenase/enoyl-CoA hydratase family protein [Bordetella bronchiseptica]|uniref:3-hydroxyacyl-CoA dehydrogenase, NAD binding domain protein n=2 Tax=Bordetella bronchiseptica TaxID=518 RepID=A0ABR4RGH4_BORBO|nr:3-hydroxyacyl-CoA dehydrogenase/enoyl-CoA hydratase family protein [Bordetella bronchiseptica]SHT03770.1 Probable 3-hydroxybutyryl-CoA dehydrogenase [Mycobacteroides abscessus subsp. abscessus]AWP74574.1 3-hydroxyacyl-CoA dehydrogenase [Bordetella bronchiseptica]AZW12070.1 3-hydroxyacyl-CoA dehydrogenase [Bordetella bronchiseptica]AZW21331.1 3-hydroxyacyl-CoA dehydrogenase [Bordetella bronchiseptica]KCV34059.1 3-hydroxyacyl-CoA dehydrogenase, NAD binding domain protein [Bordetella bronchise
MSKFVVKQAAVLGAGVMGAQIAAHLANAGVPVMLYDLTAPQGERNAVVHKALAGLRKLEPAPLARPDRLALITPANYDDDLERLGGCDLVIEAIAERLDWKTDLYHRIAAHVAPHAIVASNTSGLSIETLAGALPEALRPRFCGIHFFNPPRYMRLVEIIATRHTRPEVVDQLEGWLTSRLGKGVIRALDTPNFVANRIGVFSILAAMHHTQRLGLGFDEVDALTGPKIGRPKSATYRTADVVGLDTLAHVVATMRDNLPDDPWHAYFELPAWLQALIDQGALGQKSGAGVYRKAGKEIQVLDPASGQYRPSAGALADETAAILKERDPARRLAQLRASTHPQAQFVWSLLRDIFHYSACQLAGVADNARDLDLAMRWGFGWAQGPFETWQAAGWQDTARAIAEDIAAGRAMSAAPLPDWALDSGRTGVHTPQGSYSARDGQLRPRSALPVYRRQLFPEKLVGESPAPRGETVWEAPGVRLWHLPEQDGGIAILSVTSKMHTIGEEVLDGIQQAIARAEREFDALVMWHDAPFAVGANLEQVYQACAAGEFERLEATVEQFQRTSLALARAQIPTVVAVQGMALGGGCEFIMHASHRVLALESYIGLVEAGVGLIPAGGGSKALAVRAARLAAATATPAEVFPYLQPVFQNIATAQVAKSALQAMDMGYAHDGDMVVFHPDELLWVALRQARAAADSGHAPAPAPRDIPVAGRTGIANFEMVLVNMREGGMISAHDYRVARSAAVALCGGEVEAGTRVDEQWLLAVERREFMALLRTPETQARIRHTLDTGKPLRN